MNVLLLLFINGRTRELPGYHTWALAGSGHQQGGHSCLTNVLLLALGTARVNLLPGWAVGEALAAAGVPWVQCQQPCICSAAS